MPQNPILFIEAPVLQLSPEALNPGCEGYDLQESDRVALHRGGVLSGRLS